MRVLEIRTWTDTANGHYVGHNELILWQEGRSKESIRDQLYPGDTLTPRNQPMRSLAVGVDFVSCWEVEEKPQIPAVPRKRLFGVWLCEMP